MSLTQLLVFKTWKTGFSKCLVSKRVVGLQLPLGNDKFYRDTYQDFTLKILVCFYYSSRQCSAARRRRKELFRNMKYGLFCAVCCARQGGEVAQCMSKQRELIRCGIWRSHSFFPPYFKDDICSEARLGVSALLAS